MFAEAKFTSNVPVCEALCYQPNDIYLALGQQLQSLGVYYPQRRKLSKRVHHVSKFVAVSPNVAFMNPVHALAHCLEVRLRGAENASSASTE